MPLFVEWLEGGSLIRGTLTKEDKGKFLVTSLTGRSMSVSTKRFNLRHQGRGEAGEFFAAVDAKAKAVDLELLHETVGAGEEFALQDLASCWFSSDEPSKEELSIILSACMQGAPWFKVDGSGKVRSGRVEEIENWRRGQEAIARREEETSILISILCSRIKGDPDSAPADEDLIARLSESLLCRLTGEQSSSDWPALAEALRRASKETGFSQHALVRSWLDASGRLPEPYLLHMERFRRSFIGSPMPEGKAPTPGLNLHPEVPAEEIRSIAAESKALLEALPDPRHAYIFSVDDEGVEEIDDALSAARIDENTFRVGVHIAAPGLCIPEESAVHERAGVRCTTVYQPDLKWTMLPREVIECFSLKAGRRTPAMSTYYTFSLDALELVEIEMRLEALAVTENFSYAALEAGLEGGFFPELELLNEDRERVHGWLEKDPGEFPWAKKGGLAEPVEGALDLLVPLARRLFVNRCREGADLFYRVEYKIKVDPEGEVHITERKRNGLVEGVVTELMILTNGRTAARLAEADMPAIYRTQRLRPAGDREGTFRAQADLTVTPREHAGLGSALYCWSTSPLRRYADLLNQRQLGSLLGGRLPSFQDTSELLVRAKKTEFQNDAANRHQRRMERYWILKHLESRGEEAHPVRVVRRQGRAFVHFKDLPLRVDLDPDRAVPKGSLSFKPERFDFYELHVEGKLEAME